MQRSLDLTIPLYDMTGVTRAHEMNGIRSAPPPLNAHSMQNDTGNLPNATHQQQYAINDGSIPLACTPSTSTAPTPPFGSPPPALIANYSHTKTKLSDNCCLDNYPASLINQQSNRSMNQNTCAWCKDPIFDRYLLQTVDKIWHESCLRCAVCNCLLKEHKSLFIKNDKIYCREDYQKLFAIQCSACHNFVHACEMVMRAAKNVYHLECFSCQECNHKFCVGDEFYFDTINNKVLCVYHYTEKKIFSNLSPYHMAQVKKKMEQSEIFENMMSRNHSIRR